MTIGRKTGGRKKGTPNKRTLAVTERLTELGCDPIKGMALLAMDETNPVEVRYQCYKELAQYTAPKRRAVEQKFEVEEKQTVEDLTTQVKEMVQQNPDLLALVTPKEKEEEIEESSLSSTPPTNPLEASATAH